ncbi:Biotin/lipoate A/B protein ligase [Neopestalotiopsis sp. 37M]|nr:Biotin/lipoate A/B protein ligase [Neopestalotiopsis sp. 37M]
MSRLFMRSCTRLPKLPGVRFFSETVSQPSNKVQVYISKSRDPWLNLSIEHSLLQKSAPESTVLFLYTNRPCVVIGRNQNPWLEVNLGLVNPPGSFKRELEKWTDRKPRQDASDVLLVRRRSGGGTVFHDEGNVNYSVICPPEVFDRDRHAEMVVRALQSLGVETARVNERHDIVLDVNGSSGAETYKISGSAYKLTRLRSLHHGTCLLSSPNLPNIGQYLRSPAAPYIMARGVESVRSKIRNVGLETSDFEEAVVAEFGSMYGNVDAEFIDESEAFQNQIIQKGFKEIIDDKWTYEQTPRFLFSTHSNAEDERIKPDLPDHVPKPFEVLIDARHGEVISGGITDMTPATALNGVSLHTIRDWRQYTTGAGGEWLNRMFGIKS